MAQLLDVGGSLANVDFAPLYLGGILRKHPFNSQAELIDLIGQHYKTALMRGVRSLRSASCCPYRAIHQIFKILGSADFLGSPVSFISNMGTGWYDFFHEPAQGLISSPKDFGEGIKKVQRAACLFCFSRLCLTQPLSRAQNRWCSSRPMPPSTLEPSCSARRAPASRR